VNSPTFKPTVFSILSFILKNTCLIVLSLFLLFFCCCKNSNKDGYNEELSESQASDSLFAKAERLAGSDTGMAKIVLENAISNTSFPHSEFDYGRYHMIKGRIYYYEDKYVLSTAHLDSAFQYFENGVNNFEIAKGNLFYAETCNLMGNYARAIEFCLKSIDILKEIGEVQSLSACYNYLARIYLDQNDYTPAFKYIHKALEITEKDSISSRNANVIATLGDAYKASGEMKMAEEYIRKAYNIRIKCGNIRRIGSSLLQMAEFNYSQRKYQEAEENLTEAERIYSELGDKMGLFLVYHTLADIYFAVDKMDMSFDFAGKAYKISEEVNSPTILAKSAKTLFEIHNKTGNTKQALEYFIRYHDYSDQLSSLEQNRMIANLEHNNELEHKSKDNEILREKNKIRRQQLILLSIFAFVLLVLIIVLIFLARLRNQNFKNTRIILEKKKEMAEAKSSLHEKEKTILENNLELKNKELTSKTVELLHQIETLQTLADRMEKLKDSDSKTEVESILRELKMKTRENVWDEFHDAFNNVHEEFYNNLLDHCPDLSSTEIKIAALLKLNLSTKEIAAISYKSESAVKTARHRLRNKLNLKSGEDLITFLMKI